MGGADDVCWKHKKQRDLMGTHNVTLTPHKFWSILLCPFLFCPRLALLFCQSAHICNVAQPCEQLSRPDIRIIQNLFWSCKVITLWAAQKDCVPASVISIWKHNIIHRLAFCSSTFPTCSQLEVFFFYMILHCCVMDGNYKIQIHWCRRWHVADQTAHVEYKPETLVLICWQLQWLTGILLLS